MFRSMAGLLVGGTLLLGAVISTAAQAQKQSQAVLAPNGFDQARKGIETGKVETVEYDSKTVGSKRKLVVYTPPGYSKDKKYPVFYLLHGLGGNETNWTKQGATNTILDNLYADKKVVPMIVVMPNGQIFAGEKDKGDKGKGDKGKGGKGGKGGGVGDFITDFEKELLNDVMPLVESRYPAIKDADHRAVAGLSMGGGQALVVGLRNLDKFAWIGGFSSAMVGGANPVVKPDEISKKVKLLYVACGDSPKETLFGINQKFHNSLDTSKVKHVWNVFPEGTHSFPVWKNDVYVFSQMIFTDKK